MANHLDALAAVIPADVPPGADFPAAAPPAAAPQAP